MTKTLFSACITSHKPNPVCMLLGLHFYAAKLKMLLILRQAMN